MRFRKNRGTRVRELVVSLRRGDTTSSRQIRWLCSDPHKNYLPLVYEPGRRSQGGLLRYDVSGLTSLKGFLRRARVSAAGLTSMLVSLTEALVWCAQASNRYYSLLFDPAYVFVGSTYELHFVFLPVVGMLDLAENTPLSLLSVLGGGGKLRFDSPEAAELCRHVADFVLEQDGVFSLNALRRFVREVCGVDVSARGVAGAAGRGTANICRALLRVATGKSYELREEVTLRLGRGASCDVCLRDAVGVSREHACVSCKEGRVLLWDVGSKNGTTCAGERLVPGRRVQLLPGDSFSLDDEVFVVR